MFWVRLVGLVCWAGKEKPKTGECSHIYTPQTGNPYVYELYHNLLELLEAQGRPRHGVNACLIR